MGGASSRNVSNAVANVLNYVQNSTTASAEGVNYLKNNVDLQNCTIILQGNFNVDSYANVSQTSTQIVTAMQDTSIKNDVQQKMLQEAVSKVGSLGIGFADASNTASMLCNVTNQIINTMKASISNFTYSSNTFTCTSSYIKANNLNISQSTSTNFISEQTLNNSQTTEIVNTVSQSIEQKASATVQGLAGFLIALALLIAAVGWAISKPIASASKSIMIPMILIVITLIVVWLYLVKAPPLFADYIIVSPYLPTFGGCENTDVVQVDMRTITLKDTPPLKYNYPLMAGYSPSDRGFLVNMAVSKISGGGGDSLSSGNCGYNYFTYKKMASTTEGKWNVDDTIQLYKKIFTPLLREGENIDQYKLPNLLYLPDCQGKYPVLPQWLVDACNPVCISFHNTDCSNSTLELVAMIQALQPQLLVGATASCNPSKKENQSYDELQDCCKKQTSYTLAQWTKYEGMYTENLNSQGQSQTRIICPLNTEAWSSYLNDEREETIKSKKQLYARFWLCKVLGIDCNFYINVSEPISYTDENGIIQYTLASENLDRCYQFSLFQPPSSYADAITSGGSVTGMFGYCNNNTYKFKRFMKKVGGWILMIFVILICLFIGLKGTKYLLPNSNTPKKKAAAKTPQQQDKGIQMKQMKK